MTQPAHTSPSCEVAILAGGQGTRLRERTGNLPKPMAPILGKPLLQFQIELCRRYGFTHIALLVHYNHEIISDFFGDGATLGVHLEYLVEQSPRGTAGALCDALPRLAPTFLVLYGDTYLDVNLRTFLKYHRSHQAQGTLFLHPNDHPQDSDLVEIDPNGGLLQIHAYPHEEGKNYRNLVNAGLYALNNVGLAPFLPESGKADIAKHIFPDMLRKGIPLAGYVSPEYIKDMGTPDRLDKVTQQLLSGHVEHLSDREPRKAIFLDRDGTLNQEVGHLKRIEELVLLPGASDAVRAINQSGCLAVAITNQPVVARGELTMEGLVAIHGRLDHLLGLSHAYLDRIYACPHHPDRGFQGEVPELKVACTCRKPGTGLVDAACSDLNISRRTSWFIGDSTTDMETGRAASIRTVLVRTGFAGNDGKFPFRPDYIASDLPSAVAWCLKGHARAWRSLLPFVAQNLDERIILVGGLSRAGKTSVAQVLKEIFFEIGKRAQVVGLDSWLFPITQRREGSGVLSRYDLDAASKFIKRISARDSRYLLEIPLYDPMTRELRPSAQPSFLGPDDVVIVEGVPALASAELINLSKARIFVETDEDLRRQRVMGFYQWRGLESSEIEELLCSRDQDETIIVKNSKACASCVISTGVNE